MKLGTMLKLTGTYTLSIIGTNGKVKDSWVIKNIVTNAGKAQVASLVGDSTATPFTYIALGTSSTAVGASQTALQAEITDSGLQRASGTVSRTTTSVTNDTYTLTNTFTATGSKTIEEVGVFNASSSGTMLSRALTGTKSLSSGEQITVTYACALS